MAMAFTITSWNINSVRLRIDQVTRFLKENWPDVLCLQETKCPNDLFPLGEFRKIGYGHIAIQGQKGYNGVAIVSRHPIDDIGRWSMAGKEDSRHVSATILPGEKAGGGVTIHNFYVPAGGDIADPEENPKFAHKLAFLKDLELFAEERRSSRQREVVVGDLNIAPLEHDVWSHKQLLDVVSHTPIETEALERIRRAGGFIDTARHLRPQPEKLYSWWSYRSSDWEAANKGRRLDHVWASADLEKAVSCIAFARETRGWEKPSDHVPVTVTLDL
jgi:exodeoxyribonuclease III